MPSRNLPIHNLPKDPRHQRFADCLLSGMSVTDAYLAAGFNVKRSSATAAGKRLRKAPDVAAYIKAVQSEAADESVLTLLEKRQFLARIVRTPITSIDIEEKENADLIKSYSSSTSEMGNSLRLEKHCPLKAIEIDNKIGGDDPEADAIKALADAIGSLGGNTLPTGKL